MTENFFLVLGKQDPIWAVDSTLNLAKKSLSFLRAQIFNKVFIHLKKSKTYVKLNFQLHYAPETFKM